MMAKFTITKWVTVEEAKHPQWCVQLHNVRYPQDIRCTSVHITDNANTSGYTLGHGHGTRYLHGTRVLF